MEEALHLYGNTDLHLCGNVDQNQKIYVTSILSFSPAYHDTDAVKKLCCLDTAAVKQKNARIIAE